MRTARIIHQAEATPDWPYNVQIWRDGAYSGEGRFCKTRDEARAWAIAHADAIEEER